MVRWIWFVVDADGEAGPMGHQGWLPVDHGSELAHWGYSGGRGAFTLGADAFAAVADMAAVDGDPVVVDQLDLLMGVLGSLPAGCMVRVEISDTVAL